jgi:hypothetical protein
MDEQAEQPQEESAAAVMSADERMMKMMETVTEALCSMRNMQQDNQMMNRQILELTKEKLNMSPIPTDNVSGFQTRSVNRIKPTRPKIEAGMDEIDWKILLDNWGRYKRISELNDEEQICLELRDSCSNDVNKLLYQFIGSDDLNASELTEIKLLEYIRNVAVKVDHKEVHRLNFGRLKQNEGELASRYVGRLKVKASLCDFSVDCSCGRGVSYAADMISQQLVSGLSNPEHQAKVISEAKTLTTLEKKVEKVMSFEAADDAADKIRQPSKVAPMRQSLYKKQKMQRLDNKMPESQQGQTARKSFKDRSSFRRKTPRCRGCGQASHGADKKMFRTDCPAFGKKCNNCGKENHYSSVCEQRKSRANFVRRDDDTTPGETSDEEHEYDDEDEFAEAEMDVAEDSVHLSTRIKDFRFVAEQNPPP